MKKILSIYLTHQNVLSLFLQKLSFHLIHANTSIRWSTLSTYRRPRDLLFDLTIKLKKINFQNKLCIYVEFFSVLACLMNYQLPGLVYKLIFNEGSPNVLVFYFDKSFNPVNVEFFYVIIFFYHA